MFGNSEQIGDKPMYKILPHTCKHLTAKCASASKTIWVLGIFTFFICNAAGYKCGPGPSNGMTSPPGDIYVEYGHDLEVSCHVDTKLVRGNASNLQFHHLERRVDPAWTSIVNATTLKLSVPQPSRSESYYNCYFCQEPNLVKNCSDICHNLVIVDSAPAKVEDFQCISRNWQNLTCKWRSPHNFVKVTYKLFYQIDSKLQSYAPCEDITHKGDIYSCFLNSSTSTPYRMFHPKFIFTLNSTNIFGSQTQQIEFDHYANVIPGKPVNLRNTSRSAHSVSLQWELPAPMNDFERQAGLEQRLNYTHVYNRSDWKVLYLKLDHLHVKGRLVYEYTLGDLQYANTEYDIRIYARSAKTNRDDYWSDFAFLVFTTLPEIPSKSPDTFLGGFEVTEYGDMQIRDVIVYWKQLKEYEKNGDHFTYEIMRVAENGNSLQLQPNEITDAYAKFNNISRESLTFTVSSRNEMGYSENESYVYVPELRNNLKKPEFLHKLPRGEGVYDLEWQSPKKGLRVDSYTVFWCADKNDRPFQCKGYLEAKKVPSNMTKFRVAVREKNKIYQFAISANYYGELSSGMLWASCTLQENVVESMKDVSIETVGSTFIVMRWNLACSGKTEIIKGFRLYYCIVKDALSEHKCDGDGIQKNITLYGGISLKYGNITDLRPYSTYRMRVALLTTADIEGPASEPLYYPTLEGAPSQPRNPRVTQLPNNTILVSWDPPEFSNGVLQYYRVLYNEDSHIIEIENNSNNSEYRQTVLTNLSGYTEYNISVVACNKDCSPLSETVGIRTAIGQPGIVEVLEYNSTARTLMWHLPDPAGGKIDMFEIMEIRRSRNRRSNHTFEKHNQTKETKLEHIDSECTVGYMRPQYFVRAINYDNEPFHGVKALWNVESVNLDKYSARPVNANYSGPWSMVKDFSEFTCTGEDNNSNTMWFLIVMIPISIVLLAVATKKVWHKFKIMTDIEVILPPGLVPAMEKDSGKLVMGSWGGQQKNEDKYNFESAADEESLLKKSKSVLDTDLHKTNTDFSVSSGNTNSTTLSESETSRKESSDLIIGAALEQTEGSPEPSPELTNMNNHNKDWITTDNLNSDSEDEHNDGKMNPRSEDSSVFSYDTSTNPDEKLSSGYVSMPPNSVNAPKYVTTSILPPSDFMHQRPVKPNLPMGYVQTAPSNSLMQAIAAPHTSKLMQPVAAAIPQPCFAPLKDKGYVEFGNLMKLSKPVTPQRMTPAGPAVQTGYISNLALNNASGSVPDHAFSKNIPSQNMDYVVVANSQIIPKSTPSTPVLSPSVTKSPEVVCNPMSGYVSVQDPMISKHSNVAPRPQQPIKSEVTLSPEAYCRYGWSTEADQTADDYESLLHDIEFDKQTGSNIIRENMSS